MKIQAVFVALLIVTGFLMSSCSDEGLQPVVEPPPMTETPTDTETPETNDELEAAPDFSIKTWDGEDLEFSTYKDKTLVIWFFGSDCPPCKGIAPEVQERLKDDFSDKENYAIIGIDQWDRNNATVEGFKKTTGVDFPLGAKGGSVAKEYGTTYDRLVVVNSDGKIAYKATQRANATLDDAVAVVRKLVD